jgi:hypothetical protein
MISPESKSQYIQQVTNAKVDLNTTNLTTIYTAPSGDEFDFAIIESILVCDHDNQQTNVDLSITSGSDVFHIFKEHNINAHATDELLTRDLVLKAGEILKAQANHTNLNIVVSLVEYAKGD